jgi:hypothetical protein
LTTHQYLGKPSLSESASFKLKEAANHWRRELRSALEVGKSVVVFLTDETEMYIDTGERRYSGTGRNRQTTNLVEPFSTYSQLPIDLAAIASVGSKMKLVPGDEWLNGYWTQFGDRSEYRAILTNSDLTPAITTASGDKTVGG